MTSIDPKVIADLRALQAGGAPGFLAELIGLYLREADLQVGRIRAAFDVRDAQGLERAAHTLKGASGNLGARALSSLCAELQGVARAVDWTRAGELVPRVEEAHATSSAELRAEKAR